MTTFVALYRGQTVGDAKLIAVSADPDLVAYVVEELLGNLKKLSGDPVLDALEQGRRTALRIVQQESGD